MSSKNNKVTTESVLRDFTSRIILIYLLAMFTFYPLFMGEGYYYLAVYKVRLYRVLTGTAVLFSLFSVVVSYFAKREYDSVEKRKFAVDGLLNPFFCMCVYIFICFVSFIFSVSKKDCIWGGPGFYYGFFIQLSIVIVFFLVLNYFENSNIVWLAAFIGSGITFVLAVLNRFRIYPIDVMIEDPEQVSTIGQTNWFCGYAICFAAAGIGFFVLHNFEEKYRLQIYIGLGIFNLFASGALWVAGSDSAMLVAGIIFLVMLGFAIQDRDKFIKYLSSLLIFLVTPEILYQFMFNIVPGRFVYFQEDDTVNGLIKSHICGYLAILIAVVLIVEILRNRSNAKWPYAILKMLYRILVGLIIIGVLVIIFLIYRVTTSPESMGKLADISFFRFDRDWGTHRAFTWKIALMSYAKFPFFRKLIGAGTGCYVEYTYSIKELVELYDTYVFDEVMPNAHNEYITALVENGLLGLISLIMVFVSLGRSLLMKAGKNTYAAVSFAALMAFAINLVVSFNTIVSTPFVFIFAAIALNVDKETQKVG